MKCSGHCWKGNQPCPHPYDCSVQERRSEPVALKVRNGGESVDTELPAPTRPFQSSTKTSPVVVGAVTVIVFAIVVLALIGAGALHTHFNH